MNGMRRLPALLVATVAVAALSCSDEHRSFVPSVDDPERVATMTTHDVETFISDSGYTRYFIKTPVWYIFDEANEPHWDFPEGLYLRQYDEAMRPNAHVTCDSAIYYSRKRLWRLDGHVIMVNTLRDSFLTTQLFWDQFNQKVYSDSFIHIVRSDRIIEGYGFNSNQNMTRYTVNRPTGIIPVERPGEQAGERPADTTQAPDIIYRRRPAPTRASQRNIDAGNSRLSVPFTPVKTGPANN